MEVTGQPRRRAGTAQPSLREVQDHRGREELGVGVGVGVGESLPRVALALGDTEAEAVAEGEALEEGWAVGVA